MDKKDDNMLKIIKPRRGFTGELVEVVGGKVVGGEDIDFKLVEENYW